jgi:anaerobic ribonucleoside-triphosphate reductase activating protein
MLKLNNWDIVTGEVPDEISLALNLTNCPHRCPGCHSPELREDRGEPVDKKLLNTLIQQSTGITCVCFMGGDNDLDSLVEALRMIRKYYGLSLKTAWYTGNNLSTDIPIFSLVYSLLDYVKVGPYIKEFGPLTSKTTNQRMYRIKDGQFIDITYKFQTTNL